MNKIKLVAILRGIQPAEAADHIETLINAGFRYIEIPLNSPDWQQSIPQMVARFGEQAMIGAGTVLRVEQVDFLAEAGAKLIVTPNTQPAVIRQAVAHGMQVCAGCATATEAFNALDAGAQWLKIFPSSAFGPDYIRALKAVLPSEVPVLAVGLCYEVESDVLKLLVYYILSLMSVNSPADSVLRAAFCHYPENYITLMEYYDPAEHGMEAYTRK